MGTFTKRVGLMAICMVSLLTKSAFSDEPKPQAPKRPLRISSIQVKGNTVFPTQEIIAMSGHKISDVCNDKMIQEMRQRLVQSGYFGMHYPNEPEKWVEIEQVQSPAGSDQCTLTIHVDENDYITRAIITGSGPIQPAEVEKLIRLGTVYNEAEVLKSAKAIEDLYNRQGYSITFVCSGVPEQPGTLYVPIVVRRVKEIVLDAPEKEQKRILKVLKTKVGDYFNKQTWQKDLDRLKKRRGYRQSSSTEEIIGQGEIRLTLLNSH